MREIVHLQTGQVRASFYPSLAHNLTREKKKTLRVISAVTKSVRFFFFHVRVDVFVDTTRRPFFRP
jgi:hypothetical protein